MAYMGSVIGAQEQLLGGVSAGGIAFGGGGAVGYGLGAAVVLGDGEEEEEGDDRQDEGQEDDEEEEGGGGSGAASAATTIASASSTTASASSTMGAGLYMPFGHGHLGAVGFGCLQSNTTASPYPSAGTAYSYTILPILIHYRPTPPQWLSPMSSSGPAVLTGHCTGWALTVQGGTSTRME
jgi:hypothetical protein